MAQETSDKFFDGGYVTNTGQLANLQDPSAYYIPKEMADRLMELHEKGEAIITITQIVPRQYSLKITERLRRRIFRYEFLRYMMDSGIISYDELREE